MISFLVGRTIVYNIVISIFYIPNILLFVDKFCGVIIILFSINKVYIGIGHFNYNTSNNILRGVRIIFS